MRLWLLLGLIVMMCGALGYYIAYGRVHNNVTPQLNITYPQTPTKTPLVVINDDTQIEDPSTVGVGGKCSNLGNKRSVHLLYLQSTAEDCGALNDNESVINEAQSKKVLNCIQAHLQAGKCSPSKAFLTLQGFEGTSEVFLETNNCNVFIKQWSNTSPECGYTEKQCQSISDRFPFTICSI
ncbi:MAG: hypothetical protein UZ22_OP11002000747 [Microgenomates bacterium OLB23]|nr:MAG: hypothetical protein UZ22_OP11002000747 [Microgenomates bacterium OLB23]